MTALHERPMEHRARRTKPRADRAAEAKEATAIGGTTPVLSASAGSPPRDHYLDVLKALATLTVVVGHWLVTGIVARPDGTWLSATPLASAPWLAWITLLVQPLTVFFAIGGMTSADSLTRARQRSLAPSVWLAGRAGRLLRPALVVVGVFIVACVALGVAGVPLGTVRTLAVLAVQPLWFVGVYLLMAAVTPLAVWADGRWGWWVPAWLALSVAVVDFLRYGPFAAHVPGWVGLINLLPGWLFAYQCGLASRRRPLLGVRAWWLAGAGLAVYLIALAAGYPPTPMGVAVHGRINSHPPSLVVVAGAAMFLGVLWAAEPRLRAGVARSRMLARFTAWVSPRAMAVLCWHMAALLIVTGAAVGVGYAIGVNVLVPPGEPAFWFGRLALLPAAGLMLVALARPRTRSKGRGHDRLPGAADRR